jgi:RNA-directed DNA polymerase
MEGTMGDTQKSQTISTKLHQIAEQAKEHPERVFISLAHLMDVDFLHEAYLRTRKDGASGVDGVTAKGYSCELEVNLTDLHKKMREQRYQAQPVKRCWIAKEDGSRRPLGMPVFEDKIAQRAVNMLMSAVYEQDFYDFSYGFREGRSAHQAIGKLREQCYRENIHWIIDADVTKFFDNLDHGILRELIKKRINDGGILKLIGKWLNAGVLEGEELSYAEKGTPQGGVISPLLANIFLHYVLDEWYVKEIKPRLKGRSFLIRFADDFIIGCELEEDARRIMAVLPKRFGRFKLTIHPEKSKLIDFRSPQWRRRTPTSQHTFDFLGFTHYFGKSQNGNWVIKRKTASKRIRRTLKSIWQWCHENRHWSVPEQHRILSSKLRGHYNYYGIRGNFKMLEVVFEGVESYWKRWLGRRSRDDRLTWEEYRSHILSIFPLPTPKIVHSC